MQVEFEEKRKQPLVNLIIGLSIMDRLSRNMSPVKWIEFVYLIKLLVCIAVEIKLLFPSLPLTTFFLTYNNPRCLLQEAPGRNKPLLIVADASSVTSASCLPQWQMFAVIVVVAPTGNEWRFTGSNSLNWFERLVPVARRSPGPFANCEARN